MIVLYILLFIVFLSILIMIHELGHLLTAKMFKVYCFEYAIGFGPKLFSFKRKGGETAFSLRAVPFGGFVSMYGEEASIPEGLEIDPSRSLLAIAKWKRAIIMAAGVTMNFILAIVMFFIYEVAFPTYTTRYGHIVVDNDSPAASLNLKSGDYVYAIAYNGSEASYVFYDNESVLTYEDNTTETAYFGFNYSSLSIKDTSLYNHSVIFKQINYGYLNIEDFTEYTVTEFKEAGPIDENVNIKIAGFVSSVSYNPDTKLVYYTITENFGEELVDYIFYTISYNTDDDLTPLLSVPRGETMTVIGNISKVTDKESGTEYKAIRIKNSNFLFKKPDLVTGNLLNKSDTSKGLKDVSFSLFKHNDENIHHSKGDTKVDFLNVALKLEGSTYRLSVNPGLNMQIDSSYNAFPDAVRNTFADFGNGASLIFRSLGELFTNAQSWQNIGGLISVGRVSTQILQEAGFGRFLYFWALISVNLGIVNLLPFPGLDGWQLLVTVVEGITRKEIPPKIKGWVSTIGIILLLALMVLVLIKDVVGFFI